MRIHEEFTLIKILKGKLKGKKMSDLCLCITLIALLDLECMECTFLLKVPLILKTILMLQASFFPCWTGCCVGMIYELTLILAVTWS